MQYIAKMHTFQRMVNIFNETLIFEESKIDKNNAYVY